MGQCKIQLDDSVESHIISTFLKVVYKILGFLETLIANHKRNFSHLSEPDDEVSVQLLYGNTLDIHCKHTVSHLHDVDVNVV